MSPADTFAAYRDERRSQVLPGFDLERLPFLNRYTGREQAMDGFVVFADLPADRAPAIVREQIEHFERRRQGFEWKVYAFDRPPDLRARLEREGFRADATEVFMVLEPDHVAAVRDTAGVRIERITSAAGMADVGSVHHAVFARRIPWMTEEITRTLAERPDEIAVFCAYLDDRPVGAGWVALAPGSTFADLHGGGVRAEARGKGIYSRLLAARAEVARARGYRHLAVDAAPMSRPILERKGFATVCETWPMRRAAPA